MALLQPKTKNETQVLSVRIPAALFTELETVRQLADATGLTFPVSELLTETLARALKQARAELNAKPAPAAKGGEAGKA